MRELGSPCLCPTIDAKPSVVETARFKGRQSSILSPVLPFLSALQVPETASLAPLTFTAHLMSVWSSERAPLAGWQNRRALLLNLPQWVGECGGQRALVDKKPRVL